jgi:hypothetical protein
MRLLSWFTGRQNNDDFGLAERDRLRRYIAEIEEELIPAVPTKDPRQVGEACCTTGIVHIERQLKRISLSSLRGVA